MVHQMFGHTRAYASKVRVSKVFPLESGRVHYLAPSVFAGERRIFGPVTNASLILLLTTLNHVTLRRFVKQVPPHQRLSLLVTDCHS